MKTDAHPANDTEQRAREIRAALCKAAEARGHAVDSGSRSMTVHGERIAWSMYEPSVRRKAPLTKKELADRYCSSIDRRRGWKFTVEPSGSLMLVIEAALGGKARIADTRKRPLESRIEEIIGRFETMASETAQSRKENEEYERRALERRKRREERERLQLIEDRKWNDLNELADDWAKAERLRRFVRNVTKRNEASPDPSGRVQEWLTWARPYIDGLDPLWNGIESLLERLYPPEVSEYERLFGEPEDIDE
jgi:hypothetical protein